MDVTQPTPSSADNQPRTYVGTARREGNTRRERENKPGGLDAAVAAAAAEGKAVRPLRFAACFVRDTGRQTTRQISTNRQGRKYAFPDHMQNSAVCFSLVMSLDFCSLSLSLVSVSVSGSL